MCKLEKIKSVRDKDYILMFK